MAPPDNFLQSPEPLHFSEALNKPNESEKSNRVLISGSLLFISYLRDSSIGYESIIFP